MTSDVSTEVRSWRGIAVDTVAQMWGVDRATAIGRIKAWVDEHPNINDLERRKPHRKAEAKDARYHSYILRQHRGVLPAEWPQAVPAKDKERKDSWRNVRPEPSPEKPPSDYQEGY